MRINMKYIVLISCLIWTAIVNLQAQGLVVEDMIIITKSEFATAFQSFAELKKKEGIKTTVVTTVVTGNTPEQIRSYLAAAKQSNPDLKYVLIGGDYNAVPAYMMSPTEDYDMYHPSGHRFPTDFYYSNVLTTWNSILNGMNMNQDLYVGRVPAATLTQVQNFITKYVNYRYHTSSNYLKTYKLIANNCNRTETATYEDQWITSLASHIHSAVVDTSIVRMSEISIPAGVSIGNMLNAGNYSFLYMRSHGLDGDVMGCYTQHCHYPPWGPDPAPLDQSAQNLTTDYNKAVNGYNGVSEAYFEYLPDFLTNTQANPYIAWFGSCDGSLFAVKDPANPDNNIAQNCISSEMINNNDGAVAVYSSAWLEPSYNTIPNVNRKFFDAIFDERKNKMGKLLERAWSVYDINNWTFPGKCLFASYIYFGDPSMDMWTGAQKTFTVTRTNVLGSYVKFLVRTPLGDGVYEPVPSALCTFYSPDGSSYLRGFTDENGEIIYNVKGITDGWVFGVINRNFLPYNDSRMIASVTAPKTPLNLSITSQNNSILLSWSPVMQNVNNQPISITGYNIFEGNSPDFIADASHLIGATTGTTFTYSSPPSDVGVKFIKVKAVIAQ